MPTGDEIGNPATSTILTAPQSISITSAFPTSSSITLSTGASAPSGQSTSSTTSPPIVIPTSTDGSPSPPGPIVGAAFGGLIGGLAIGFLVAFLILKYKKRRENNGSFVEYPAQAPSGLKSYAPAPTNIVEKPQFSLDQFLLDSTPDRDLGSELISISELIQNHVENNYHLKPVKANSEALDQTLVNLGLGKRGSTASSVITARALDPRTRHTALNHVISHVLFSSVDFDSRSQLSMLPAPIAAFIQSVPPIEKSTSSAEATTVAMNKWRVLSAFLLHPTRSQRTSLVPSEAALESQIVTLASALNTFLEPFVPSGHSASYQQNAHLRAVVFECAKFGYALLSQPSEWRLNFGSPSSSGGVLWIVTCPSLEKIGGKDGARYESPVQVVAPVMAQA